MKRLRVLLALVAVAVVTGCASGTRKVEDYNETVGAFKASPAVQPYFASAYGYALYPTVGKGGIGIGGAFGDGQVYQGGKVTGFSSIISVSIGFQLGGQAFSEIIFFENKAAYDKFTTGEFEFSAQATAVAITASAQAQAGTGAATAGASTGSTAGAQKAKYQDGMAVFTYAKGGLMYEASIGGQKFSFKPVQ